MTLNIKKQLFIDISKLLGHTWSVKDSDLKTYQMQIARAARDVDGIRKTGKIQDQTPVLFPHLPYILDENLLISKEEAVRLKGLGTVAKQEDAVISIGIGGSYLGNQVLFDVFCGKYWNLKTKFERNEYPQVYFAGQNLDPGSLLEIKTQIQSLAAKTGFPPRVLLLVISKSGTTIECSTALKALTKMLGPFCDLSYIAITDHDKGWLHDLAKSQNWPCFTVPNGIGGRFSVFSQVGLVFASLVGIPIEDFLDGAKMVEEACQSENIQENPALMLSALKYIAMKDYGLVNEVIMPYGDKLRSFGWWFAQLLGESLGKKYDLNGDVVYNGRTPIAAVGTTDMHSLTQEHQEGKKNKLIQFISIRQPDHDFSVDCQEGTVHGPVPMSRMLEAARSSNEEALAAEGRMSCHVYINRLTPFHLGALMYFFILTIAYEGAMANINAYNQPGVETYKKIMHADLKKYLLSHQSQ